MTLKIDDTIEEIERALAGNKPKYANDIYLNNAIRYLQEIKSPSLTDDQRTVLEALKVDQDGWDPFFTIWHMMENDEISNMPTKQQYQVLAAFVEWGSN